MEKPLFDDVGKDLKQIAESIARRVMIRYGLLGAGVIIVSCAVIANTSTPAIGFVGLLIGIGLFIFGYNQSKLAAIKLYAYGELVDRVMSIERKLVGKKPSKKPAPKPTQEEEEIPNLVERNPDGSWNCPFCEHRNPAGADWCEKCGVAAEFE